METKIKLKSKRDCKDLASRMDGYNVNSMLCGYSKKTDACQVRITKCSKMSLNISKELKIFSNFLNFRVILVSFIKLLIIIKTLQILKVDLY